MRTERTRRRSVALLVLVLTALATSGCADMKDQARYEDLEASKFFKDGRSARPLPEGTVARGFLREDDRYYRGIEPDGTFVAHVPAAVDQAMLARGRDRFEIYCRPCHSQIGDGMGMVVRRGYKQPPSYHIPRLRSVPDGYIYDVITNGFGQMSSYASQVKPADRWAIVAYIRALQLSQDTDAATLAPEVREALRHENVFDPRQTESEDEHGEEQHGSAH